MEFNKRNSDFDRGPFFMRNSQLFHEMIVSKTIHDDDMAHRDKGRDRRIGNSEASL